MPKKILFLTLFFISISYSQTKSETENYIINKLKLYAKKSTTHTISYYLDGTSLSITYDPIDDRYEKKRYVFPVWAITAISLTNNGGYPNLYFSFDKYCKSCKKYVSGYKQKYKTEYYTAYKYGWEYGKQVKRPVEKSRRVKDGYTRYDNETLITSTDVEFTSSDPEEDFIGRFIRAINHLKTLYPPKPKSDDLFGK